MSLRKQAKIIGVSAPYLSQMINGKRPWNRQVKTRYDELVANTFANTSPESVNKRDTQNDEITSELGSRRGFGGAEEARTPDPLLAKQVLSQLSYSPIP